MDSGSHYCAATVQTVLVRYAVWNVASSGFLLERVSLLSSSLDHIIMNSLVQVAIACETG